MCENDCYDTECKDDESPCEECIGHCNDEGSDCYTTCDGDTACEGDCDEPYNQCIDDCANNECNVDECELCHQDCDGDEACHNDCNMNQCMPQCSVDD